MVPSRTRIQRYEDNKENELLQCKLYPEKKQDKLNQYHKNRYEANKEKLNERIACICGSFYTQTHKARHEKTQIHQNCVKEKSDENE